MASGAMEVPPSTVRQTVNTRKKVPMNSVRGFFMAEPPVSGAPSSARDAG